MTVLPKTSSNLNQPTNRRAENPWKVAIVAYLKSIIPAIVYTYREKSLKE
jgi:hypothetical protein